MILFAFTCFIAAMIQALCGFGSGVFIMSVLPHFFHSYSLSLVLSTVTSLVMCVIILAKIYKYANIRMIIPLIIGCASAITAVMCFWNGEADATMKKALGVFLVLLSLYFIFFNRSIKVAPTFKAGLLSGFIGGTTNSLFSMGGPPVAVYMIAAAKDNREYLASSQVYFCFSGAYVTISRYMRGMVTEEVWPLFFAGLPFVILGTWAGMKLFSILDGEKLRLIIYVFMAVSGAVMILS